MAQTQDGLGETAPGSDPRVAEAPLIRVGGTLDRYRLVRRIGEGGMGVVYEAHDPELDRRVALKVLRHPVRGHGSQAESLRARLVREAQAMARVTHANVVPVYDAGSVDEDVFVAMALVDGEDLARWLRATARGWREVVDLFVQAGRGLGAAHRAGIIHRDFKPANVIVGRDGHARVADFGLARAAGELPAGEGAADGGALLASPLTLEGDLLGTPMYMAPEQHAGNAASARSDQWSFCASLWEGLGGQPPFAGTTFAELAENVAAGRVRPLPPAARVPRRLRRAVLRGLEIDPARRHPDMDTLVDELVAIRRFARRARAAALGAAAAAALAVLAFSVGRRGTPAPCSGAAERLAGAWDTTRRAAVAAAFGRSTWPGAAATLAEVERRLDVRAGEWVAMRTSACEASARGEQSAELLDLRMACLERRRSELDATTALLARADDAAVLTAVPAVIALPPLGPCADGAALRQALPPPADPARRARVEALRIEIDRAAALRAAGKYAEGLDAARALAGAADGTGYPPLRAEALAVLAGLEDVGGDPRVADAAYRRAAAAAAEAGDDRRLADAWAALVYVLGVLEARPADALQLGDLAATIAARARDPAATGKLHNNLGLARYLLGQLDDAAREIEIAIAHRREAFGADHPDVASSLGNLGAVKNLQGAFDEAEQLQTQALEIRRRLLGPDHPEVAVSLTNLGAVAGQRGDPARAAAWEEQALAIRRRIHGERHASVALSLANLGSYAADEGRHADALRHYERAVAIDRITLPPAHPDLGAALNGLAESLVLVGRAAEALPLAEESVLIHADEGAPALNRAHAALTLGMALVAAGREPERARRLIAEARAAYVTLDAAQFLPQADEWAARARRAR